VCVAVQGSRAEAEADLREGAWGHFPDLDRCLATVGSRRWVFTGGWGFTLTCPSGHGCPLVENGPQAAHEAGPSALEQPPDPSP
jgi:hypothetical protein